MDPLFRNVSAIQERVRAACARVRRSPDSVRIIGVTKTVSAERIREGVKAGILSLGENYVQELRRKAEALEGLDITWHFIGHLQSNKAKTAVQWCRWIHTVDRESLARELDRQAQKTSRKILVLLQVKIGDEESKSGIPAERLPELFSAVEALDGLQVRGLMALPPYEEDPERTRPYFRTLHRLLGHLRRQARAPEDLTELSMGMSHDFEVAVEEGATMIRIGTALFGSRSTSA
ncbi:MAG TPA: YggS family pyridoxal phosphate-dependent enzyme [Syntrophobacteraceae bacterium]|mgnify:CR=1 FL=1|nr:YggS family pyridoxal phosphate-dependent enzyme [Syntrophobacteraceae bacterium]